MNTNEAISIKEKLEEVLIVIDEYGKQAKQFSEAKDAFGELIKKFSATNDAFTNTVINSDEFLKSAQKLIDVDYVNKVKEKVNEISEMEVTHQNECNDALTKISFLAESFESKANSLTEKQLALQETVDAILGKMDELIHSVEFEKDAVINRIDLLGEMLETRFDKIEKYMDCNQKEHNHINENDDGQNHIDDIEKEEDL